MTAGAVTAAPPSRNVAGAGLLAVDLARDTGGRTRITGLRQRFPQRVTVPMYLDRHAPGTAYLCVQNPTAGLFPGEELETRVTAGPGTGLQLSGQAATQVFAGGPGTARHDFAFTLADGAVLEHVPTVTVPHRGCAYGQRTCVRLTGDAVFFGWETVAAGRIAHGERHGFRRVDLRTVVERDGETLAVDALRLEPARQIPDRPGLLGGHDYLATALVVAPCRRERLDRLADTLRTATVPALTAVSSLPGEIGLTVRILAHRGPDLHRTLLATWHEVRRSLLNRPGLPERIHE